jgi:hypothetical protein
MPRKACLRSVSGIQSNDRPLTLAGQLDSRHAVPRPRWGLAARRSESTRE